LYPAPAQLKFAAFVSEAFPTSDVWRAFGGIIYLLELPKRRGGRRSVDLFYCLTLSAREYQREVKNTTYLSFSFQVVAELSRDMHRAAGR
jgi:hypothetical protein